jgi:tetratricopeptide (TPR) repeat protein
MHQLRGRSNARLLGLLAGLALLFGYGASVCAAHATAGDANAGEAFLRAAPGKLHARTFGLGDARQCMQLLKRANQADQPQFACVYARFLRIMKQDPVEALAFLAPCVLEGAAMDAWEDAQDEAARAAVDAWRQRIRNTSDRAARKRLKADEPDGLFADFPAADTWQVDASNAPLAIEIARCHMDLARFREALAIIDTLGKSFTDETRVLSAESAGDLMVHMQRIGKGIGMYEFGLKVLGSLTSPGEGLSSEQKILKTRIQRKLGRARRLREIEQYGKGWVLYRDAERERRERKHFLQALLAYEDLAEDFPGTVYSEAAGCYRIKSLLALAQADHARRARKEIHKAEEQLAKERKAFAHLRRKNLPRATLEDKHDALERLQARLARMKRVPLGRKASGAAKVSLERFLNADKYGLYRGEAMASMARAFLDDRAAIREGFRLYERLYVWIQEIEKLQHALDAFRVPGKAEEVAKPPQNEKKLAGWNGYIAKAEVPIGAVINRLNCPWHLDALFAESGKLLSFYAFATGDGAQANAYLDAAIEHDHLERRFHASGLPNSYERLRLGYGKGWLRTPKEFAGFFPGRLRLVFLLGDFYYEIEDEDRCLRLRKRLVQGWYGQLNSEQEAAAKYRLAGILYRRMEFKKAEAVLQDIVRKHADTSAEGWAYIALGNLCANLKEEDAAAKSIGYYEDALKADLPARAMERGLYFLGHAYIAAGQFNKAARAFRRILERYPKSVLRDLSRKYLEKVESQREKEEG